MGLENVKRWQWMLISLLVGGLLAYAQLYDLGTLKLTPPDERFSDRYTIGLASLIDNLNTAPSEKGFSMIADLIVYPQVDGKIEVIGNQLRPVQGSDGKGIYKPFRQTTEIPFELTNRKAPRKDYTVVDYLTDLQKRDPKVTWRFAWWATPKANFAIWMGGSFLLIGLLFPTFISVLMGSGYMPAPQPKKKQAEPSRTYGGGEVPGLVKPGKRAMTAEDQKQLEELTAKLEQSVGDASVTTGTAVATTKDSATIAAVRKLEAAPLESSQPATDAPKENVEWGGEFYPVAHSKHKDDEK